MRIISWNINGLKTRFNDLKKLIEDYSPDVVCLQKVRCSCERDTYQIEGYKILYSSADFGNWSGVMMYAKIPSESKANSVWEALPKSIFVPRELSNDGHLQAYHCNNFALINAYVPYANPNIENAEYYRIDWDYKFKEYIHDLSSRIPVIICGDFNVVHTEKDTCEPKLEINRPCFSKPERRRFDILLSECKLVDAFRFLNPNDTTPTFYGNFRHLQIGNRLDYFLVSNHIKDKILSCKILKNFSEGQSDPIMLEIANGPLEANPKNKPFIFYNTMIDNSINNESDNSPVITDDLCDTVFFSSLLCSKTTQRYYKLSDKVLIDFKEEIKDALAPEYKFREISNTNDIWARDFMPVQIFENKFWNFRYYPDYLTQTEDDRKSITNFRNVTGLESIYKNNDPDYNTIADGGNVVKCDGYVIMTRKVFMEMGNILNNLNIKDLSQQIGTDVVIVPNDSEDKYGHTDGLVRYVSPNTVLLRAAQDETDKKYLDKVEHYIKSQRPNVRVLRLQLPYLSEEDYEIRQHNWCYINFLRLGNKILIPQLGIQDDAIAIYQFKNIFEGCEIKPINMLQIVAAGGGALNCLSWTIKANNSEK